MRQMPASNKHKIKHWIEAHVSLTLFSQLSCNLQLNDTKPGWSDVDLLKIARHRMIQSRRLHETLTHLALSRAEWPVVRQNIWLSVLYTILGCPPLGIHRWLLENGEAKTHTDQSIFTRQQGSNRQICSTWHLTCSRVQVTCTSPQTIVFT